MRKWRERLACAATRTPWLNNPKKAQAGRLRHSCQRTARILLRDMSEHKVSLRWERGDAAFEYPKYPRNHTWKFDGGHEMTATAAPAYLGDPKNVDPEEAFVAALSSCHMLTFLAYACKKKFVLDRVHG